MVKLLVLWNEFLWELKEITVNVHMMSWLVKCISFKLIQPIILDIFYHLFWSFIIIPINSYYYCVHNILSVICKVCNWAPDFRLMFSDTTRSKNFHTNLNYIFLCFFLAELICTLSLTVETRFLGVQWNFFVQQIGVTIKK